MLALTYDPTVSLGAILSTVVALLTVVTLIIGMVTLANKHAVDMALLKKGQDDQKGEFSIYRSEIKSETTAIRADVAAVAAKVEVLAVVQQRLADGKERMDKIDERLRSVEMGAQMRRKGDSDV